MSRQTIKERLLTDSTCPGGDVHGFAFSELFLMLRWKITDSFNFLNQCLHWGRTGSFRNCALCCLSAPGRVPPFASDTLSRILLVLTLPKFQIFNENKRSIIRCAVTDGGGHIHQQTMSYDTVRIIWPSAAGPDCWVKSKVLRHPGLGGISPAKFVHKKWCTDGGQKIMKVDVVFGWCWWGRSQKGVVKHFHDVKHELH